MIYSLAKEQKVKNISPNIFTRSYFGAADPDALEKLLLTHDDKIALKKLIAKIPNKAVKILNLSGYNNEDLTTVLKLSLLNWLKASV